MKADVIDNLEYTNYYLNVRLQDVLRNAVIKYIDHFYPNVSEASSAIDNKIEQAMDLVKSHLLYTVREEVEVLKERIVQLLDRINQLEVENNFLRANATPEVINALNSGAVQAQARAAGPNNPPISGAAAASAAPN